MPDFYFSSDKSAWINSCPEGYAVDSETCLPCEAFSGYSGALDNPNGITVEEVCKPTCGDGIIKPGEECDDGNVLPEDGCSPICLEELWVEWADDIWSDVKGPIATLEYESLSENEYTLLLYFDEPVVIQ